MDNIGKGLLIALCLPFVLFSDNGDKGKAIDKLACNQDCQLIAEKIIKHKEIKQ